MSKIVILTSVHPAFDVRIFHKQAKSLVKAGHDVVLIAQHDRNETVDGVKFTALPRPRGRFQRMSGLAFRVLHLALKEKADVYHFHDPELMPVGLFLKFLGAKVIYDVHENYSATIKESEWLPRFIKSITASVFNIFEKTAYRFFDAVITATASISRRFLSGEVLTLHNYPILQYGNDRTDPSSFHEGNTVIYIGGLSRLRGIVEIIKSLKYIDEKLRVKLKLLGQFSEPEFEKEVRSMEMFSRVTLGYVPYEELNSHLCAARVGLVILHPAPNYISSMPTKLFEYMSAGLPVIASNFPLWKYIVEKNNCGLTVDPTKPREIAAAVEYLIEKPELMEEMGKNGKMAAQKEYNWEQESVKLLDLMTRLTGR